MKKILFALLILISFQLFSEKVGLALSGGGARGFAHIGLLKVIDEIGLEVDCISGSSIGGVIGGLYAMGYSGKEIEQIVLNIDWSDIIQDKVKRKELNIYNKRWNTYSNYNFRVDNKFRPYLPKGLIYGQKLINTLFLVSYDNILTKDYSDFDKKFSCVATNLENGSIKLFNEGNIHESLRATISLPSFVEAFEIDDELYIDGGISKNLPVEEARDLGADFVIASSTDSYLMNKDELNDIFLVLRQTIGINMKKITDISKSNCDLLIEPNLSDYSAFDFSNIKEIIEQGESNARLFIKELLELKKDIQSCETKNDKMPDRVMFSKIRIDGNKFYSSRKIKEFSKFDKNKSYNKYEIVDLCNNVYNTNFFYQVYPIINKENNEYVLTIKVKEKERINMGILANYSDSNDLSFGLTYRFNNVLLKNSQLLTNFQIGGKKSVQCDFVKNFGKHLGIYFRLYPYVDEKKIIIYNSDHEKMKSVKSLEYGGTFGLGVFLFNNNVFEPYSFFTKNEVYNHISQDVLVSPKTFSSGYGVKALLETLDDEVFPMTGVKILSKYHISDKDYGSDLDYEKLYAMFSLNKKLHYNLSLYVNGEYGSYFNDDKFEFDPFYIGGIDSFWGINPLEYSAPNYKMFSIGLRSKIAKNLYSEIKINSLKLSDNVQWEIQEGAIKGLGILLGYKTPFGPIRYSVALNEDKNIFQYFMLGYSLDPFEFSKK